MASSICRHSAVVGCVPVPNASPGSRRTTTASGVLRRGRLRRAHPQTPPETHRFPILRAKRAPSLVLEPRAHARSRRDVRSQDGARGDRYSARRRWDSSNSARTRVSLHNLHLIRLGFEHGLVAAVQEGDRARADLEQRCLDLFRVQGGEREFNFIEASSPATPQMPHFSPRRRSR